MNSSEDKQDLYMFNAPSFKTNVPPRDETGAIVGALTACIIISAVLLFLWKVFIAYYDVILIPMQLHPSTLKCNLSLQCFDGNSKSFGIGFTLMSGCK